MARQSTLPEGVAVRPVERADLLAVFRIEKACFPQPWPYSAFEEHLGAPGFLVAANGEVLGYVVGDTVPNHGADIGHVKDLAVRPAARRRGIGRRLLRDALGALARAGAARTKLEVRETNEPAIALYRDEGFRVARRVGGYYADGEDALIMVRDPGSLAADDR